ncbi:uncharacterized protein MELLADRAFT_60479 [Melampsora larici-populina 98AG31]|uniref:Uncharacterized protein n=1 Tax=Melampsora larici-populina (strain 98AG31 / pathotype 3-4-7) TaxID=747676 RepID=F4RBB8_MELLP|nr:uncharacterized protein MELLADRAFT_60479 [Melampsora larici-populina 98AG31]EGG10057.1 hypothetical protein MELLADRAFT_60479 [Melampsora larici-populina 98AG31]
MTRSFSKRELTSPGTVLGEVYHYVGNEAKQTFEIDDSNPQQVPLHDLRALGEVPDLKTDGFTYVSERHVTGIEKMRELSDEHRDALEEDSVELVKELTRAKTAFSYAAFFRDHTSDDSIRPVPVIHSDLSPEGAKVVKEALQEVFMESKDPTDIEIAEKLGGKGVMILNVWRPIHTVQDNPLGFCKWDSLLEDDAMKWKIGPTDTENGLQAWRYRKGQRWVYLREQEPHEVWVFMQHDARAHDGHGINIPHASFTLQGDQNQVQPSTRMSFETAIIALVEPPPPEGILSRFTGHIQSYWNQFKWNDFN